MSLRHALLGQLSWSRASGYALMQHFARTLGYAWPARHSQIYPELARLEAEGLIRRVEEGPRGRKQYAATPRGQDEVRRWLRDEPRRTTRSEASLRIFLLWLLERAEATEYLHREVAYHRAVLDELEEIAEEQASDDTTVAKHLAYRLALEEGLRVTRARAEWAEWAAAQVAAAEWRERP